MRLLQSVEREVAFTKERELAGQKANEITRGITALTKDFNEKQEKVKGQERKLLEGHLKFKKELEDEQSEWNGKLKKTKAECDAERKDVEARSRALDKKMELFREMEERITMREKDVRVREKDLNELDERVTAVLRTISETEKHIDKKTKHLEDRETHFKAFRAKQEKLFKDNEQKLRDYVESHREEIRKQRG